MLSRNSLSRYRSGYVGAALFILIFLGSCEYIFEQSVVDARELDIIFYPNPKYEIQDTLVFKTIDKTKINDISSWYLGFEKPITKNCQYDGKLIFKRKEKILGIAEFSLQKNCFHYRYFLNQKWHYRSLTTKGIEDLTLLRKTKYFPWQLEE